MLDKQRSMSEAFVISFIAALEAERAVDNVAQALFKNQVVVGNVAQAFWEAQEEIDNVVCDQSDPEERERAWHNIEKKSDI